MTYQNILTSVEGRVGIVTLNRPKALNALNAELLGELAEALEAWDRDDAIGCIVLTGSDRAFAAGADIKEMAPQSYMDMFKSNFFADANDRISNIRKPIIAAVAGWALGGGCELAMLCDFIIAADTAKFGQPEINLGVMPGIGGTQRLTRYVGKSKAMEMCLTGRNMDAAEAERAGLVSRVVPAAELMTEAKKAAQTIAEKSLPIAMMTKETVNRAYETTLSEGIRFERRVFHAMFATEDQKEGMAAFSEKTETGIQSQMIAKLLVVIFVLIGILHLYWAMGQRAGESAVVPSVDGKPLFQPSRWATVAVALALFSAATVVAIRSGILSLPGLTFLALIGCWGLVAVFGLRAIGDFRYLGFFKRVTGTRFARADTFIYSPLCAVLAAMAATVAMG